VLWTKAGTLFRQRDRRGWLLAALELEKTLKTDAEVKRAGHIGSKINDHTDAAYRCAPWNTPVRLIVSRAQHFSVISVEEGGERVFDLIMYPVPSTSPTND